MTTVDFSYGDKQAAREAFNRARAQANFQLLVNRLLRRPLRLRSFEEARKSLGVGVSDPRLRQDVCLERVVGSVGRARDLQFGFRTTASP